MDSDFETDYATDAPGYATDGLEYATDAPLPSPSGTPYRTPSHLSLRASTSPSPSPFPPSSSPPNHGSHKRMSTMQHDTSLNESISILDPRRFTPTLHANLVAEILNLRRELESKSNFIDQLERDLAISKTEHETATTSAATAQKEARDVRRQLARAEQDDAMGVLSKDRDDAIKSLSETRKQMERISKARRIAEEDLQRIKRIQESDSERFEGARKALERRALVAEGRLKAVLDEIASNVMHSSAAAAQERPESEEYVQQEVAMNDNASVRTSLLSLTGRPTSLLMDDDEAEKLGLSLSMAAPAGLSLADELNFHNEDSDEEEIDEGNETEHAENDDMLSGPEEMVSDVESLVEVDELPEFAEAGVQVNPDFDAVERIRILETLLDEKSGELETTYVTINQKTSDLNLAHLELDKLHGQVRKLEAELQSNEVESLRKANDFAEKENKLMQEVKIFEARGREVEERWLALENKSTTLQMKERKLDEQSSILDEKEKSLNERERELLILSKKANTERQDGEKLLEDNRSKDGEYEANARRKRAAGVASPPPTLSRASTPVYVSAEMQTLDTTTSDRPPPVPPKTFARSTGIQTEPLRPPPLASLIPAITVSPPPPTPPLPQPPKPAMKDSASQTTQKRTRSQSMQTEEINIDERLRKLAPHLLPSALLQKEKGTDAGIASAPNVPRRSSRRTQRAEDGPTTAPGSHGSFGLPGGGDEIDAGSLPNKSQTLTIPTKPINSYDEFPHSSGDEDFADDADGAEYRTALSPPRPRKARNNVTLNTGRPSPVPEALPARQDTIRKSSNIRKNAMVTSGVNAHNVARSSSMASNHTSETGGPKIGPPFPVPMRHSSRRTAVGYDRSQSPTPGSARGPRNNMGARHARRQSIRKVRSAAALPSVRDRNRSPPPLSISSAAPDSPEFPPPLPRDEILSPAFGRQQLGRIRHKRQQASTNTSTTGKASVASSTQQTSVVDAIAQTMVGEWMWKYVRRRKSFGMMDTPETEEGAGGQRHKRWVWLAPYERAVMWSSRQPTSGTALLGKTGRKRKRSIFRPFDASSGLSDTLDKMLTNKVLIQSVLDVKDDTPMPKNSAITQPIFDRSILILTPARALKFTAPSRERHYVWLTALSFLSHSPPGSEGMLSLPPPMPFEYEQLEQQAESLPTMPAPPPIPTKSNYAFSPIRDSVRLAKGKSRGDVSVGRNGLSQASSFRSDSIPETRDGVAEPPSIPRHSRKRSNTAIRPGTRNTSNSYERSIASQPPSINSDLYYGVGGIGLTSRNSSLSHGSGGWEPGAMGTVRMEAFVDPKPPKRYEFDEEEELFDDRPSSYRLRNRKTSKLESYFGVNGDFYNGEKAGVDEDFWRNEDPFRGF